MDVLRVLGRAARLVISGQYGPVETYHALRVMNAVRNGSAPPEDSVLYLQNSERNRRRDGGPGSRGRFRQTQLRGGRGTPLYFDPPQTGSKASSQSG